MKDSVSGAIVSLCVLLALNIVVKIGEVLWKMKEKRDSVTDLTVENLTTSVDKMTFQLEAFHAEISALKKTIAEFDKIKTDLRRSFVAVRLLAGDKWSEIRKELDDDTHLI